MYVMNHVVSIIAWSFFHIVCTIFLWISISEVHLYGTQPCNNERCTGKFKTTFGQFKRWSFIQWTLGSESEGKNNLGAVLIWLILIIHFLGYSPNSVIFSVSDCYARQIMGAARSFALKFSDSDSIDVMKVVRPQTCSRGCCGVCCQLPIMHVENPPGIRIAYICETYVKVYSVVSHN